MPTRRIVVATVLIALLPATARPARAWLFHEHRRIVAAAISELDDRQTETLVRLWEGMRSGREARFCVELDVPRQEATPECLDLASLPAIAGDHACSFQEMLDTVRDSDWIMKVTAIADRGERKLAAATTERQRTSADVQTSLDIARADTAMASRAAGNNGHFLLHREGNDLAHYLDSTVRAGAPLNGIGIYARNHMAALRLAAEWGGADLPAEEKAALARAALAREIFALHYLEDAFAAGHVAGCWGRPAERLGTHNYYNEHGLETMTWAGVNAILLGDRHLRAEDLERAAPVVRASLAQFLEAARPGSELAKAVLSLSLEEAKEDPPLDACKTAVFPDWGVPPSLYPILVEVVVNTPMPGRGPGIASLPRSHAEVGGFISWVSGLRVGVLDAPFEKDRDGTFVDGEVFIGVRGGIGLDSLTGRTGDGLVFFQLGVANRQEKGPYFTDDEPSDDIPGRTGIQLRLRTPFWLVPGDLILAAPILAAASPQKLKQMAITAANGGLIPWQRAMPVGENGRFQFVLGREVGVTLHGQWGTDIFEMPVSPSPGAPAEMMHVEVQSVEWEFPILEWRAFRTFAGRQSYASCLQVGAGFDDPEEATVVDHPGVPAPELRTRRFVYMRLTFDVRHYF